METSEQITSDLRAVLAEHHTSFELLNTYKGVPLICRAVLQKVENQIAFFQVHRPEMAILADAKTTQILSDGLLEPIEAQILSFDPRASLVGLAKFIYAGSRLSNGKELRLEPRDRIDLVLKCDQQSCTGELVDISMQGAGVRVTYEDDRLFGQNKTVEMTLRLPEGDIIIPGRLRNISPSGDQVRLAVEFTGTGPEKSFIVRYILHRRAEIYSELQEIFATFERTQ